MRWPLLPLALAELHGDLFSHHSCPLEVYVFVAVDERGEHVRWLGRDRVSPCRSMLCPKRFVIVVRENSEEGGVAAEVCSSSQTRWWFCTLRDIYARIHTYYTYDQIYSAGEKETPSEIRSRDRHVLQVSVQNFRVYLLNRNRVDIKFWCGKHVYLREMLYRKTCL